MVIDKKITEEFEKNLLIVDLIVYASNKLLNQEVPLFPILKFLSIITLLKRIISKPYWHPLPRNDLTGVETWSSYPEKSIKELIDFNLNYIITNEWNILNSYEENWGSLFTKKGVLELKEFGDLSQIVQKGRLTELVNKYGLSWIETASRATSIIPSLFERGFFPRSVAERKYEEQKQEYEKEVEQYLNVPLPKDIPSFIAHHDTETLVQFLTIFQQNALWYAVFKINKKYEELDFTPLLNFINSEKRRIWNKAEFYELMEKYKISEEILTLILFEKDNLEALPFFFETETSHVLFSRRIGYIIFLYIIARSNKGKKEILDFFNKDGPEFEKITVPELFRKKTNMQTKSFKDKKYQIDLIAYNNDLILVSETKRWEYKPFSMHRSLQNYLTRDLIGIIEGRKYTTRNGVLSFREIPSLIEKVEFINKNKVSLSLPNVTVKGLVITRLYPPFRDHKNCLLRSYEEIDQSFIDKVIASLK